MAGHEQSVRWLSQEYYEQNGSYIVHLESPPTALQFSRIVHISRPIVIKGYHVPALDLWTDEYLIDKMGSGEMTIALTPNGLADAVTPDLDGTLYFAEPLVEQMTMRELLSKLTSVQSSEACYLQSQNGNLYSSSFFTNGQSSSEFEALRQDAPSDVPWCTEAFDRSPDAVNLWIGNSRSTTSIHSDPYENIYTVIRGAKYFTLLPPTDGWCLKERRYLHATYVRENDQLVLKPTAPPCEVRWSSVTDPHIQGNLPIDVHPIHIELRAGETLYLPAGWWHHVRQSDETTIALNWWYDIEMRGMQWVMLSFLRAPDPVPPGNQPIEEAET